MTHLSPIVVGVDGSDSARRALRWAVETADGIGCAVIAVTAWHRNGAQALPPSAATSEDYHRRAELISKHDVAATLIEHGTNLPVVRKIIEGAPAQVLTDQAHTARMLVLGGHGHGRLHHAVLGSVSEECLRLATCPVVVIPAPHAAVDHRYARR